MKSLLFVVLGSLLVISCASKPTPAPAPEASREAASLGANNNKELIYNALNVPEKDGRLVDSQGRHSVGAMILMKSVGGLTCRKTTVVVPNAIPTYECAAASKWNDAAIYKALNVPEEDIRPRDDRGMPSVGMMMMGKSVGGLTCRKDTVVVPNAKAKYSCLFTF